MWDLAADNNYAGGRFLGSALMLPAAGYREASTGTLYDRGGNGNYWGSSEHSVNYKAWYLTFNSGNILTYDNYRRGGFSVRCIAE